MIMKEKIKHRIHQFNTFLNKPIAVIIVLLVLFAYFAYGNAQFSKDNRTLIENTKQSVDLGNKTITNLQQGILDLLASNDRQTRYLGCLLAIQGRNDIVVSQDVQAQCEKMSNNLGLGDVTKPTTNEQSKKSQDTNNPSTSVTPSNPSKPDEPSPKLLNCKVDFFNFHIGC